MRLLLTILFASLHLITIAQPGSSCSNPYRIVFNAPATPNNLPPGSQPGCIDISTVGMPMGSSASNHSGTGAIIWLEITYQNCQQIWIQPSAITTVDVTLYNSNCSTLGTGVLGQTQSLDLIDGSGWWSTSNHRAVSLVNGQRYLLRLRFGQGFSGTVKLCAYQNAGWQSNSNCINATPVTSSGLWHNNACAADNTIDPTSSCAVTMDNTAFYKITITAAIQYINFGGVHCPNCIEEGNFPGGYCPAAAQIGFFQGSCGSLQYISCNGGVIGNTSFQVSGFPIGTALYFTVDGREEANCNYSIYFQDFPLSQHVIDIIKPQTYPMKTYIQNPVKDGLRLNYFSDRLERVTCQFISMEGKVLIDETLTMTRGMNMITWNLSKHPAGTYLVMLSNSRVKWKQKIVKQ